MEQPWRRSFYGVKALATSLGFVNDAGLEELTSHDAMDRAASVTVSIIKSLDSYDFPIHTDVLNLNTPVNIKSDEVKVCKPDRDTYGKLYEKTQSGKFNRTDGTNRNNINPHSDTYYLRKGFPTITPISLELAPDEALDSLKKALEAK